MCSSSKRRSCMGSLHCAWSLQMCSSAKTFIHKSVKILCRKRGGLPYWSYKAASQELFEFLGNKRMTGFRLNWRIKNPPQIIVSTEAGGCIKSSKPLVLEPPSTNFFYEISHFYQDTLILSDDLIQLVGNGSPVVWLEANTREEEDCQENVTYTA